MTDPYSENVRKAIGFIDERVHRAQEIAARKREIEQNAQDAIDECEIRSFPYGYHGEQAKAYWSRILAHAAKRLRDLTPGPTPAEAWQVNGERDAEEREAERRDDEDAEREAEGD